MDFPSWFTRGTYLRTTSWCLEVDRNGFSKSARLWYEAGVLRIWSALRLKGFDAEFVMLGHRVACSNSCAFSGSFFTRVWGRLGAAHSET